MSKSLKFKALMVTILVFIVGFLLLQAVSKPLSPEQKMMQRCGLTQPKGYSRAHDHRLQLGWDSSHRFYVLEGEEGVGIVDTHNGQCCVFGIVKPWFDGAFTNDTYSIRFHNQYGWSTTTSLDLRRWEVSIDPGECFQGANCSPADPPQIVNLGYCEPKRPYGIDLLLQR
ncbi:hypothetical protein ARNL5_01599 [Anaerolineae bacterium]|nr:hypothetical protein ARNL5_01599 [Anaerolineae bacterium]